MALSNPEIDHDGAVGVDDLERGARHGDRSVVAVLDDEFPRPDGGRDPNAVDGEGKRAGQHRAHRPHDGKIGGESFSLVLLVATAATSLATKRPQSIPPRLRAVRIFP